MLGDQDRDLAFEIGLRLCKGPIHAAHHLDDSAMLVAAYLQFVERAEVDCGQ